MAKGTLLVVDDEKLICWSMEKEFTKQGYEVLTAMSAGEGLRLFNARHPDVVLLDISLPDGDGRSLLRSFRQNHPDTVCIMITANDGVRTAVECMRLGAFTYLNKPFEFEEVRIDVEKAMEFLRLRRELKHWQNAASHAYDFGQIVGESEALRSVLSLARQVAASQASTVLLEGESGTGKDLFAKAIHYVSARRDRPFVSINCAAFPDQLLESELFGYEKGAFTDARQSKKGLVEEASGGALFLDELGDLQPGLQAKLLHLIDQKKYRKIGAVTEHEADVRIMAATNKNLKEEMAAGRFREDLYYRLNVMRIFIPALRTRKADIPALAARFIIQFNGEFKKQVAEIHPDALEMLMNHDWPGNVRELKNMIERAMILCRDEVLLPEHFPAEIDCRCVLKNTPEISEGKPVFTRMPTCLHGLPLEDVEKSVVVEALKLAAGNQTRAAKALGIGRDALRYKMQKFGLSEVQEVKDSVKSLPS